MMLWYFSGLGPLPFILIAIIIIKFGGYLFKLSEWIAHCAGIKHKNRVKGK